MRDVVITISFIMILKPGRSLSLPNSKPLAGATFALAMGAASPCCLAHFLDDEIQRGLGTGIFGFRFVKIQFR